LTGLDKLQQDFLGSFCRREDGYFLTGGGALVGYHLHHRRTLDLDLFTIEDRLEEGESALRAAALEIGATAERLRAAPTFRRFLLSRGTESVVVDLARDLAPQIEENKLKIGGVNVDPPREIMANKLCTLLSRAELRDLVDVRALEHAGYSLEDHLPLAMEKDSGLTAAQLAYVLSELEIGDDASPPGGVTVDELRTYLQELRRRLTVLAYPE
jgi:hypothetical protein